jgi:hypothetical protein
MIKTLFLVPERDNEGKRFGRARWEHLEHRVMQVSAGFSYRAEVHGTWQSDGRVYRDVSREFTVSLQSWQQFPSWLALVEWIREQFQQEALYIEVAGLPEILVQDGR